MVAWENLMAEVPIPPTRTAVASGLPIQDLKPQQRGYRMWYLTI